MDSNHFSTFLGFFKFWSNLGLWAPFWLPKYSQKCKTSLHSFLFILCLQIWWYKILKILEHVCTELFELAEFPVFWNFGFRHFETLKLYIFLKFRDDQTSKLWIFKTLKFWNSFFCEYMIPIIYKQIIH